MIKEMFSRWLLKDEPCDNPRSIFIGLTGGVGDLLLAAPSVAALKKKYSQASICFGVGDSIFYSTIKNDPHIDRFETPFIYNVWKKWTRIKIYRQKRRENDLVLLLDNPSRDWWKEKKHLIDIYAEKCGVALENRRPAFYLDPGDYEEAQTVLQQMGITEEDRLLVLSPEVRSKREMKEWPHERFMELLEKINNDYRFKIITFVSKENQRDYHGTITLKGFPMGPSAAIIRRADLYIGLDNGLSHLAACFDTPLISIHIGYPEECCRPLSPHAFVIAHEPFSPPESITVDEVYKKVKEVLKHYG